MAIRSLSDFNVAFEAGRFHVQRFIKNAGTPHARVWADTSFASGHPVYDARVGLPLEFKPAIAQKNDAIWFPGIAEGEERYLVEAQMWSNQATTYNGPISVVLFDLLGYYPLIDGDSTEVQTCTNSAGLPRYANGVGVQMVMVNHIAPAIQHGLTSISYVDSDDIARSLIVDIPNNGQNIVCSGSRTTTGAASSTVHIPLSNGEKGVKRVTSIQHSIAPGGFHCLYLVRILGSMVLGDNLVCAEKNFIAENGFAAPRIYDGAWLGWFDMISVGASNRSVSWFGNFTFAWG
jgi:hypothetical protein